MQFKINLFETIEDKFVKLLTSNKISYIIKESVI